MAASSSIHSNAFNFMSFLQSGVDPRTGLYTVSISLPELKTDDLAGPVIPLALSFSPLNTLDTGFGLGWNLQLSQYTPHDQILALSTGETFKVTGTSSVDNQLLMKEKKLDSFHLHDLGGGRYKVVHKSGLVEILQVGGSSTNRIALPHEIQSPDGRKVSLSYGYFGDHQVLESISDAQRRLLTITRSARSVEVLLQPDDAPVRFTLSLVEDNYKVSQITLPTAENACWRFDYVLLNGLTCIKQVWNPVGGHETVEYNDAGHAFPGLVARPNLPRVTDHITDPGSFQPKIEARYSYRGNGTDNGKNFLGYNASGLVWEDDGLDNLYKITGAYVYGTTESLYVAGQVAAVRTVQRSFNRFHLLTEETTTQNKNVKKVVTVYYANDGVDFANQPVYCQLPKTVTNSWSNLGNPNLVRRETVSSEYDLYGNLAKEVQANGITETSRYYPAGGEPGLCPADPEGFVRQLKEQTVTPASSSFGSPAPTLCTRYHYQAMAPVTGGVKSWLVIKNETLQQLEGSGEQLMQTTAYNYFDVPGDALRHGRQRKATLTLHDALTYAEHSTSTDFIYEKTAGTGRAGETVLKTTQTLSSSFDSVHKVITLEHSLLNGEPLLNRDDSDVEIRYTYDALGRVVSETVAPGTDFAATRRYAYGLVGLVGQTASQTVTDVKGVQTRSHLDGLSRVIKEERQDVDNPASAGAFRQTYTAQYDARGQLLAETDYDWLGDQDLPLKRSFGYDDWGQQDSETGPEGVVTFNLMNPFGWTTSDGQLMPTQSSWQQTNRSSTERYGLTVTQLNLFEKPDRVERFTRDGNSLGKQEYRYDGLGRTVEEIDALSHSTLYRYDAFDRMVESTLPDKDKVKRSYAGHSSAELATLLTVQPSNQSSPEVNAGGQVFDGLERLTEVRVGPRVDKYRYNGGQLQVSERVTPRQDSIHYEYALGLTQEPITTVAPDESVSFSYDVKSARMTASQNTLGQRAYAYDGNNHLKEDKWTAGGNTWTTRYVSSLQGRQLQRTDVSGLTTLYDHDRYGRVQQVNQGQLQARFEYDPLGRLDRTLSTHLTTLITLETRLTYDEHHRETLRTLSLTNQPTRTLSQTWRADDQLQSRHLKEQERSLLEEDFQYDTRGRLVRYDCSGETLPKDRYGNEIVSQSFRFDALDNVTLTLTTFADQMIDRSTFIYNVPDDPCQLLEVKHTHDHYPPSTTFAYDADGNMLNDELGQRLHYDSQGRLLNVETASGNPASQYRYDGHNHLVSTQQGAAVETLRFYEGDRLSNTVQGSTKIQYLYDGDTPLGQQQVDDDTKTLLLMTNASNSVLGESQHAKLRTAVYSAYGERSSHDDNDGELQCLLAFNGEVRDQASGWYLLGQGYRAYNPTLMRFHSPDSLSPFGAGGVNPYGYCQGNPIAFQDPTGHSVGKLEHRVFNVNKGALVTGLLMTAVFTGLAVASLGSATPFIMAVTVLGTGAMIAGTGYKTAALLNHDPEEQQRLYQIGDAFDKVALFIGIGQGVGAMGKKMLKREAGGMLVDDWGKGVPDFFSSKQAQGSNWTFKSGPRTSHNTRAFKPDANAGAFPGTSRSASTATSLSSTTSSPVSRSSSLDSIPDMDRVIKDIKSRQVTPTTPAPELAPPPAPNHPGSYIDAARRAVANSPNDASNVRHV